MGIKIIEHIRALWEITIIIKIIAVHAQLRATVPLRASLTIRVLISW